MNNENITIVVAASVAGAFLLAVAGWFFMHMFMWPRFGMGCW